MPDKVSPGDKYADMAVCMDRIYCIDKDNKHHLGIHCTKKAGAVHSVMNKVTGGLLFILPLTFPIVPLKYLAIPVCAVATIAAVQEGHYIRTVEKRA